MSTTLDPGAARRRFVTATFLFWFPVGLYIPSQVLLLLERGIGLETVAALFAVHSFTVAALELPTGGLSDVLGRRGVLAAAGVLFLAALTLLALGTVLWVLVVAMLLAGTGRALCSGPAEAWYVDTVQAYAGPDAELRTGLARGVTAVASGLATGTLCGGVLPWMLRGHGGVGTRLAAATGGHVVPLSVPVLLGAAVLVGYVLYVLTMLPEPPRPPSTLRSVLRGVPATVLGGLSLGARNPLVRRLLLSAGAAGVGMVTIELLAPGRAAAAAGSPEAGAMVFAGLACAGFGCTALGSRLAPWATELLGGRPERGVLAGVAVSASGLLLLGGTSLWQGPSAVALAAAGYVLVYVGLGSSGPNKKELLHRQVDSAGRATALSVQSLAVQLAGALAGLAVGGMGLGPLPWTLAGCVMLATALLWVRGGGAPAATGPVRQERTLPVRQGD